MRKRKKKRRKRKKMGKRKKKKREKKITDLSLLWQVAVCILLDELKQFRPFDCRELVFSHGCHQLDDCLAHCLPAVRRLQPTHVISNKMSQLIMFLT